MIDYDQAGDLTAQIRGQERIVVAEGHASIGLAVGTEHVCVGEDSIPTKHFAFIDRVKADRTNAVKRLLAQSEVIYVWRRRAPALGVDVTGVVHQVAEAGMSFQPTPIGHVHRVRGNIIDRGVAVRERKRILRKICRSNPFFLGAEER